LKTEENVLVEFAVVDRIDVKLYENNIHFLSGEIDEISVDQAIRWIVSENLDKDNDKPLELWVNSIGGDLYQCFALIDIMKTSRRPIKTVGLGSIQSCGFLIFVSGTKGMRHIHSNTGIMCHQYSGGNVGKHHDLKASMREGELCNQRMMNILKEATGLTNTVIKNKLLTTTDVYLTSEELVALQCADSIIK
jgi:ATP-dependent Clp protease protease subunit